MLRFGSYRGFYNPMPFKRPGFDTLRRFNALIAKHGAVAQKRDDTADPAGYKLTVHYKKPKVRFIHPDDQAVAIEVMQSLQRAVTRSHVAQGGDPKEAPNVHLGNIKVGRHAVLFNGRRYHLSSRSGAKDKIKILRDVQAAHASLAPEHERFAAVAAAHGGRSATHRGLPAGLTDDPAFAVRPHVKRGGVHASTFHFKSKADAWRAMTSLGSSITDAAVHDSSGEEVLNLLQTPSKKAFESGAFRDRAGRFSSVDKPGGGAWVPNVPRGFRSLVEKLGGKVKCQGAGGALAAVFPTVEACKAAHAALAEQGHRVSPHDVPGVLLVSFLREPPVHEAKGIRRLDGNPNQKEALALAAQLGADVQHVHRTGEVRVQHRSWPRPITMNSRRKDTPRELVKRLNQLIGESGVAEARPGDSFYMVKADQAEAEEAAQAMADRIHDDVAVVACHDDPEDVDYMVIPLSDWMDPDDGDPEGYTLVAVFAPSDLPVEEAVARRRSLAARLSAARIRGRPLGGKRLRAAMRAKAWRRAHPGRTARKRMHTLYRTKLPLNPL